MSAITVHISGANDHDFWFLQANDRIQIYDMVSFLTYQLKSFIQENLAINIFQAFICIGKMNANITKTQSAKQCITNGMQEVHRHRYDPMHLY